MLFENIVGLFPKLAGLLPFFIFTYMILALWGYFGFQFIGKARAERENLAQKSYFNGFAIFVIIVAVLEGLFLLDQICSLFGDFDIFWTTPDWQSFLRIKYGNPTFELNTLWNNDYWSMMLCSLLFGLSFLTRPLERYMLGHKSTPLATACVVLTPAHGIVRVLQINSFEWFGIELKEMGFVTVIFYAVEVIVSVVVVFAFLVVIALYYRMATAAPSGSLLRKKSIQVEVGLWVWLWGLLSTSIHQNLVETFFADLANVPPFAYLLPFTTGTYLIIALLLLASGMRREYV